MTVFSPINARSYYDYLPSSQHQCGDIWVNLPSIGLLSAHPRITGIMITPACDVSNFKTETLTYLPVVPVSAYLGTVAFLPIVRREVLERYKSAKLEMVIDWPEKGYEPPTEDSLQSELTRLQSIVSKTKLTDADKVHIERAAAGLRIVSICRSASKRTATVADYALLFGKNWEGIKRDIVRNSYRPDIHFLPADEQNSDELGLREHSAVLFRYPISVPSEILTAAQTVADSAWQRYMTSCAEVYSASTHFRDAMPIKILSLKASFLSDLSTRFTALYGRIGSPDFSSVTVDRYAGEIA